MTYGFRNYGSNPVTRKRDRNFNTIFRFWIPIEFQKDPTIDNSVANIGRRLSRNCTRLQGCPGPDPCVPVVRE